MPNPNAMTGIVAGIVAAETTELLPARARAGLPGRQPVWRVDLTNGQKAYLDDNARDVAIHTAILARSVLNRRPVYLGLGDQSVIRDVMNPILGRVVNLRENDGALQVDLDSSARRLTVGPSTLGWPRIEGLLRRSLEQRVLLTIAHGPGEFELLDADEAPEDAAILAPPLADRVPSGIETLTDLTPITDDEADTLFRRVSQESCSVPPAGQCIPFNFPDDGCNARAHQVCRMLNDDERVVAGKVWIYGTLEAATPNHERCKFGWAWHVAACVRVGDLEPAGLVVFDPAIFERPVPLQEWTTALHDPSATVEFSEAKIFLRSIHGDGREENPHGIPPGSTETEENFKIFRDLLSQRIPPPPFQHCRLDA